MSVILSTLMFGYVKLTQVILTNLDAYGRRYFDLLPALVAKVAASVVFGMLLAWITAKDKRDGLSSLGKGSRWMRLLIFTLPMLYFMFPIYQIYSTSPALIYAAIAVGAAFITSTQVGR